MTTEFRSDTLLNIDTLPQLIKLRYTQSQICTTTLISSFSQCSRFILAIVFVSRHISLKRNLGHVITLVVEWIDTYGIHHWRILRSSYRKLTWIGFEPRTTDIYFCAILDITHHNFFCLLYGIVLFLVIYLEIKCCIILVIYLGIKSCNYMLYIGIVYFLVLWSQNKLTLWHTYVECSIYVMGWRQIKLAYGHC